MTVRKRWLLALSLLFLLSLSICPTSAQEEEAEEVAAESEECVVGEDGLCEAVEEEEEEVVECFDKEEKCQAWAYDGECTANSQYMLNHCAKSCRVCGKTRPEIVALINKYRKAANEEMARKAEVQAQFGVPQNIPGGKDDPTNIGIQMWWAKTKDYMNKIVRVQDRYEGVRDECQNKHADCTKWATRGECQANPNYMYKNCLPACRMCHYLIFDERCPYDGSDETNIWKEPNQVNQLFERITIEPYYVSKYTPTIHSQPTQDEEGGGGPWLVSLENFLSTDECNRLIELGAQRGYEHSKDVGTQQADGTYSSADNPDRTSSNAWCLDECFRDPVTQTVLQRIENLTDIPDPYSEYLQLLKYEEGQKYGVHHDFTHHSLDRAEGHRLLTVFLYLNDVQEGGETNFPELQVSVQPKCGRAVVWPSVLNEDYNAIDQRTDHQALPVLKGIKYGANAWIHMRDFKDVFGRGCAT